MVVISCSSQVFFSIYSETVPRNCWNWRVSTVVRLSPWSSSGGILTVRICHGSSLSERSVRFCKNIGRVFHVFQRCEVRICSHGRKPSEFTVGWVGICGWTRTARRSSKAWVTFTLFMCRSCSGNKLQPLIPKVTTNCNKLNAHILVKFSQHPQNFTEKPEKRWQPANFR
jgi:hypothetical protein